MSETQFEIKTERDDAWFLTRDTGATIQHACLRVHWRPVGERRWRKKVFLPEGDQTLESLRADAPLIVKRLAEIEAAERRPGGNPVVTETPEKGESA